MIKILDRQMLQDVYLSVDKLVNSRLDAVCPTTCLEHLKALTTPQTHRYISTQTVDTAESPLFQYCYNKQKQ